MYLLGYPVTDQMRPENLTAVGLHHGLHEAAGLPAGQCLAIGLQAETPDPYLSALLTRLLLGQTDTGDLRPTVDTGRNQAAVQGLRSFDTGQDRKSTRLNSS